MKAEIKLYCNKETKRGYPVILYVRNEKIRKRVNIGWFFKKQDWNFETETPIPSAENFDLVYPLLLNYRKQLSMLQFHQETNFQKYVEVVKGKKVETADFYTFAEGLIADLKLRGKFSNAQIYGWVLDQLKIIKPELPFSQFNYTLLRDFKNHKQQEGVKNSTIHNYLRTLRAIYNEAVLMNATEDLQPFKMIFKDLTVRKNRTKKKYLSIKGIKKLEKLENLPPGQQFTLQLFLLQFYFGGQDLIDVYYLRTNQIKNNRVYFERKKIGERGYEFDLLIIKKAQKILNNYVPEGEYVFPGRKDFKGYQSFRRRYQTNLHILQKKAALNVKPKGENLGIKVARYTFANRAKKLHIIEDVIRELMGHERNDIDTIYKDKYPQKTRDKALLKITSTKNK
ncbi:phage integrase SAM-like domain-containing protein [Lutibacter holmesii]|uniref:Phage integrase SAM-like domain-containing protein n=1 Tax=Lutibacter holmesii TaxID=1137985 RepID=A0ABW3WLW6_9FLAO